MVEWWQAGVLSMATLIAGALVSLFSSWVQRGWTASDVQKAEERQARRRAEEEKRQSLRDLRRERMQQVTGFLNLAKRYSSRQQALRNLQEMYDENVAGLQGLGTWDEFRGVFETRREPVDFYDLVDGFSVALATAAPTEVRRTLRDVLASCGPSSRLADAARAIQRAEETLESYLVDVQMSDREKLQKESTL